MFHVNLKWMRILLFMDGLFYRHVLSPAFLICHLRLLIDFLSGWSVHWCKWGVKIPYYYCIIVSFSLFVGGKCNLLVWHENSLMICSMFGLILVYICIPCMPIYPLLYSKYFLFLFLSFWFMPLSFCSQFLPFGISFPSSWENFYSSFKAQLK